MSAPAYAVRAVEKALGCERDDLLGHVCVTCRVPFADSPDDDGKVAAEWTDRGCEHAVTIADAALAGTPPSVWVVIKQANYFDGLALVAATAEAAKRAAAEYVGESELAWEQRNSIFDFQDYFVAKRDGCEYHVYEEGVCS